MNEGVPMMYYGSGAFTGPGEVNPGQADWRSRQYPSEVLQIMGGIGSEEGTPRRWQPRRERQQVKSKGSGNGPFAYDSDDSSLSSNASGTNKCGDKVVAVTSGDGEERTAVTTFGPREWRARPLRRETRAPRRIAPDRYLHTSYPLSVKYTPEHLFNGSEYDTLSKEIWDKFVKSQQTEDTFRKKMNLWRYLHMSIRVLFPRFGLYVVGSTMSGFGLESSDMDLCLYVRQHDRAEPRAHALLHLAHLLYYIRAFDPGAELIQAKVPILKFRDARHGLHVDLNCNNVVGVRNTNLLHCFAKMDWRVRPLVTLTKLWAQAHNINDARQRTLSSYSLTLMVIHFLQCGVSPPVLPAATGVGAAAGGEGAPRRPHNRTTLGELFILLLKYYAEFPWQSMAVSVRCGARVPVAECRAQRAHNNEPHQWKLLCVEEPFELTNTARSVYDPDTFALVVDTFRRSAARLLASRRLADAWPRR